jgi:DNA-directed RNA polymerase subunit RPC12/RpoP
MQSNLPENHEIYLPLDCPICGRRRLILTRTTTQEIYYYQEVRCEKCNRIGDEIDEETKFHRELKEIWNCENYEYLRE